MKISLSTRRTDEGWVVEPNFPAQTALNRGPFELRRTANGYPLPPSAASAQWVGKSHERLCKGPEDHAIDEIYQNLVAGDPNGEAEVVDFGNYLTAILLGDYWPTIREASAGQPVELELRFEDKDYELHRLPWEMMFDEAMPLGAQVGCRVAITRVVGGSPQPLEPLELPLRLLFVVGKELDDALRPGSEYLGLLRRFEIPLAPDGNEQGVGIHVHLLTETTSEDLKEAIQDFQPQVVHFICHGRNEGARAEIVLSKRSKRAGTAVGGADGIPLEIGTSVGESKRTGTADDGEDGCTAARLLLLLMHREGDRVRLPQVVVLNVCHTGEPDAGYLAFAAQLVAGGVPVAIGMAGEVADAACRIFTLSFYEALVGELPLSQAAAQGRRAALIHRKQVNHDFLKSVDWARPTVYMARGIQPAFAVSRAKQDLAAVAIRYRTRASSEMLCDRFNCLRAYQAFQRRVPPKGRAVLLGFEASLRTDEASAAGQEAVFQLGKTWMLEEIMPYAVLDGFVLCCLLVKPKDEPPKNLLDFALMLASSMDEARSKFRVPRQFRSAASDLGFKKTGIDGTFVPAKRLDFQERLDAMKLKVRAFDGPYGYLAPDGQLIRAAIQEDLFSLVDDVRRKVACVRSALILIDDLHRYEGVAPNLLAAIDDFGLGDDRVSAPLVFSYSARSGDVGGEIQRHLQTKSATATKVELKPFQDHEYPLAYSQYLMSLQPQLAINWRKKKQDAVADFFSEFHDLVRGVPSNFNEQKKIIKKLTEWAQKPSNQALVVADDEAILKLRRQLDV